MGQMTRKSSGKRSRGFFFRGKGTSRKCVRLFSFTERMPKKRAKKAKSGHFDLDVEKRNPKADRELRQVVQVFLKIQEEA